jgi:hypothetical protein
MVALAAGAIEPPERPPRRVPLSGSAVTPITSSTVVWMPLDGDNVSLDPDEVQVPVDGLRLRTMRCTVTTAPGTGETVTLAVVSGDCGTLGAASPTSLACSITNAAKEGSGSASVLVAECGAVKVTYSSGAATSVPTFRLEVQ